ncbi:hypothetical protein [Burkholderia cenocepacia]|uniref:hypothetical protein n=1 Tax=Burkholderia cenocepacia TaxID=95486 RepID=UPI0018D91CB4|nr:hypothetical protein [Burkholderia cenocepacia]
MKTTDKSRADALTDGQLCAVQYATEALRAIAERREQVDDVIRPLNDIRTASRRAAAALKRFEPVANALLAASPASQPAAAPIDDARECLMDVVSHHDDFEKACRSLKDAASDAGNQSDASYWLHQIDVLDRMKAQAELALARVAQPEPAVADEQAAFERLKDWPKMAPREVFYAGWRAARASSPNAAELERALSETIDERDQMEEAGTRLANAVGEFLGVDVGEWSSANDPILTAIEALRDRVWSPNAAGAEDALDTLVAVLNAIGYTEEFAAAHPALKVSEGVKLFLAQAPNQAGAERAYGVFRTRPDENDGKEFFYHANWHNDYLPQEGERIVEGWFAPSTASPTPPPPAPASAPVELTDEDIESMANACGLHGVRQAVVKCVRALLEGAKHA